MHSNESLLGPYAKPKRDWRATLFDRLNPGAGDMGEEGKERLGRAGLMQLASGLLSTGGGFGNALAAGLSGGQKAMSQGVDDVATQQYKRMLAAQQGNPAELQAFNALTEGLSPEDKARAARIKLRLDPGAVGASPKFQLYKGPDGVPRSGWAVPNSGQLTLINERGEWETVDPGLYQPVSGPMPTQAPPQADPNADFNAFAQQANADAASRGEPPLQPQELVTVYRQMKAGGPVESHQSLLGPSGQPSMPPPVSNEGPLAGALPPRAQSNESLLGPAANRPNNFVGRRPEDEASAVRFAQEQAAVDAQVGNADRVAGAEATVATAKGLATDDIGRVTAARETFSMAQEQLNSITALNDILSGMETGKPEEFYAKASQYFGGAAGATYQAQQALVSEQVNAILNAAKGPQTDQDAKRALAAIPSMGNDPRARKVVMEYIEKKLRAKMSESGRLMQHFDKNQSLRGYQFAPQSFRVDASPVGGRAPAEMSDDEIMRGLSGGR